MKDICPARGLVLGGSGFLGSRVVERAVAGGHEVVSACRRPALAPASARGRAREVEFDVRDSLALERLIRDLRPAWIVNCAALSRAAMCEADTELASELNAQFPVRLAEISVEAGARIVHVSTDLVFDGEPPRPSGYRESDPARPLSAYGQSKLEGDLGVLQLAPGAVVARLPLLYGSSEGRGLGASDSLLASLERSETPALFTDELRTPLDVVEAAAALVELAAGEVSGLLHLAGPRPISRFDLGLLVLQGAGRTTQEARKLLRPVLLGELDLVPRRPRNVSLDSSVARGLLSCPLSSAQERLLSPGPEGSSG